MGLLFLSDLDSEVNLSLVSVDDILEIGHLSLVPGFNFGESLGNILGSSLELSSSSDGNSDAWLSDNRDL